MSQLNPDWEIEKSKYEEIDVWNIRVRFYAPVRVILWGDRVQRGGRFLPYDESEWRLEIRLQIGEHVHADDSASQRGIRPT